MAQQHPTHNYFGECVPLKAWEEDDTHYRIIKDSGHVIVVQSGGSTTNDQVVLSYDQITQLYAATHGKP
jgi:hypothetical protein